MTVCGGFIRLLILLALMSGVSVWATSGITYHGRLLKPDNTPVTSSSVQFRLQIRTPGIEDCLLYEEIQTQDLSATSGVFSLSLGDGSGVRQDGNAWGLFDALSNRKDFSFSASDCNGTNSYSPASTDNRKFRVFFDVGSGWEALPVQAINYIPMSIETYAVGGFPASSLFRVEDAGVVGNVAALTTTQYNNLVSLADGSSSVYEKSGSLNGSTLPSIGSGESVRWNGTSWESYSPLESGDETDPTVEAFAKTSLPTCNTGEVLKSDGSVLSCVTDTSGTLPDVGTPGTYTKVTTDSKGRVTSGDTLDEADLPNITTAGKVSGDAITSGEISGSTSIDTSGNIVTTGNITATGDGSTSGVIYGAALQTRRLHIYDDDTNFVTLKTPSDLSGDYALTLPVDAGASGQVLSTDGSGGLSWISPSTGSVTGVSGTSPIQVSGTTSVTISVDDASTSQKGVVQLAASTDTTAGLVVQADDSRLSDSRDPSGTAGGDLSGTYPNPTVSKIQGISVSATDPTSSGHVLRYDGTQYTPSFIDVSDIRSNISGLGGDPTFPTSCTASQTLTWSALTDAFTCSNISMTAGNVSSTAAGNLSATNVQAALEELDSDISGINTDVSDKVAKSGDTMTGSLGFEDSYGIIDGDGNPRFTLSGDKTVIDGGPWDYVVLGSTVMGAQTGYGSLLNITTSSAGADGVGLTVTGELGATGRSSVLIDVDEAQNDRYALRLTAMDQSVEILTATSIGRVGIGTTAPANELSVNGVIESMSGGIRFPDGTVQTTATGGGSGGTMLSQWPDAVRCTNGSQYWHMVLANGPWSDGRYYYAGATEWIGFNADGSYYSSSSGLSSFDCVTSAQSISTLYSLGRAYNFVGGGSNLWTASGSDTFFGGGNVGIGTNNPTAKLEVVGTIKATGFEGPLTSTSTSLGDGTVGSPSMTFTNDSDTGLYSSGANTIGISAGGSKVWDITTSGIVSPTAGGASISSGSGTAAAPTFSFAGDTDTGWFHPLANTLAASTGALERMRIDSSGNVGIGTTDPQRRLHVRSDGAYQLRLENGDTGGGYWNVGQADDVFATGGSRLLFVPDSDVSTNAAVTFMNSGNVGIGTTNPTQKLEVAGAIKVGTASATSGSVLLMDNYTSGNLTVFGTEYSSGGAVIGYGVVPGTSLSPLFTSSTPTSLARSSINMHSDIRFYTGPLQTVATGSAVTMNEVMRIKNSGNVGIGTTNPLTLLQVGPASANIYEDGAGASFTPQITANAASGIAGIGVLVQDGTNNDRASLMVDHTNGVWGLTHTYSTGSLPFVIRNGGTEQVRVTTAGNVGIGTNSPGSRLEIHGDAYAARIWSGSSSTPTSLQVGRTEGEGFFGVAAIAGNYAAGTSPGDIVIASGTGALRFATGTSEATNGTTRLTITNSGDVGVGTTDPIWKLDVRGAAAIGDDGYQVRLGGDSASGGGTSWVESATGRDLGLWTGGSGERMRILNSNGNVGIGTTTPGYKLDVNGTIRGYGITDSSDIRLKSDVQPLQDDFDKILQLQGVSYYWKDKTQHGFGKQIGVIAQDVEKVYPELVETDDQGMKSVNYSHFVAPLIEAFKTLTTKVADLFRASEEHSRELASIKAENTTKDQEILQLKARLDQAERENAAMKAYLCEKDPQAAICH